MSTLPTGIVPAKPRRHHRPRRIAPSTTPTGAPVLVAASIDSVDLTLTFDRAIVVPEEMQPNEIAVFDGVLGIEYRNTLVAVAAGANSVVVTMIEAGEFTGEGVTLSASGATGIVSVDGGEQWAAVEGIVLPLP